MATEHFSKVLNIPAINKPVMHVQIVGRTPLITERFGEIAQESIEGAQQGKVVSKMKKPPRDPEAEFREKLYILPSNDGEEHYGIPSIAVKEAMVKAGGRFTEGKMTEYRGVVNIPVEYLEIISPNPPRMRSDRVVIGRGTTSISYRPEFSPWYISVPIQYLEGYISPEHVVNLLSIAGFAIGIGGWRPERDGTFGQFDIGDVSLAVKSSKSEDNNAAV